MIVTGHEAFLLTLFFVVTGYITHSVAARFTFRRSERPELLLLRFLAYGTVNALISFLVVVLHTKVLPRETWAGILVHNLPTYFELAIWVLFLIPALLGVLLGVVHFLYGVQSWYRTPIAAWDERIARSRGQWVLISLEGGTKAAGFLGRESSVVSDTGDKDLYLQTLWREETDGTWGKVPRSRGMLISGKTIQSVEFWEDEAARSATPWGRLRAWAFSDEGHTPPAFKSSLITDPLEPEEALKEASRPEDAAPATPVAAGEQPQALGRSGNGSRAL